MTAGTAGREAPPGVGFGTNRIAAARRSALRTAVCATVPLLSIAAVFYNTRDALYLCFLLPAVQFLPGRVDMPGQSDEPEAR